MEKRRRPVGLSLSLLAAAMSRWEWRTEEHWVSPIAAPGWILLREEESGATEWMREGGIGEGKWDGGMNREMGTRGNVSSLCGGSNRKRMVGEGGSSGHREEGM